MTTIEQIEDCINQYKIGLLTEAECLAHIGNIVIEADLPSELPY